MDSRFPLIADLEPDAKKGAGEVKVVVRGKASWSLAAKADALDAAAVREHGAAVVAAGSAAERTIDVTADVPTDEWRDVEVTVEVPPAKKGDKPGSKKEKRREMRTVHKPTKIGEALELTRVYLVKK